MESEPTAEKGKRRKLKRIVQKKPKINLNSSASAAYYKRVKAALNASLNSSRASQTLKANNKALAQSLQHVKQELRFALNENGRLKVENQDLTIRLLRFENQAGSGLDQASYERLQGLKVVLNNMSRHLLDLGTCVNDGMDLCLISPRHSQASTSRPQSLEEFQATEAVPKVADMDLSHALSDAESGPVSLEKVEGSVEPAMAAPDMSIIMEQSMLGCEEGVKSFDMEAVPEESPVSSNPILVKASSFSKLPQRVRNEGISSIGNGSFNKKTIKSSTPKTYCSLYSRNAKSNKTEDSSKTGKGPVLCSPRPRRQTFVISKDKNVSSNKAEEIPSTDDMEDITSVTMPDLASASPMRDEQMPEAFDEQDVAEEVQIQSPQLPVKSKGKKKPTAITSSKDRTKSGGRKTQLSLAKSSKTTTRLGKVSAPQNDSDFFISNPCSLNLVHKRVTGSTEGCMGPESEKSSPTSLDSFMAEIKESNRKSSTVASFLAVDDNAIDAKSHSSVDRDGFQNIQRSQKFADNAFRSVSDEPDHTMYFDDDMEFTEVLPQHPVVEEEQGKKSELSATKRVEETKQSNSKKREISGKNSVAPESENKDKDNEENSDKKLPVALRVNKPGQMVFSVCRKEEDGSRKAIPAKLQTHTRSKSKKQMEEMIRNLPQKEPENIFDFHDQTPQSAPGGKSNEKKSVFDLSLNDTVPGIAPSLSALREKIKVINAECQQSVARAGDDLKLGKVQKSNTASTNQSSVPSLLGNAPAYTLPLKDDTSDHPEPQSRSRGRSASKENASGRHSRSKSRSSANEMEDETLNQCQGFDRRSKSRKSRSEDADDNELVRRSVRSKNGVRKTYTEDNSSDDEMPSCHITDQDNKHARSRSRSRTKKKNSEDDEEYKPTSRSRVRKTGEKHNSDDEEYKPTGESSTRKTGEQNSDDETMEPALKQRGRSRSRRRVEEDKSSERQDETYNVSRKHTDKESDNETKAPALKQRGRSRSGRRAEEDKSSERQDETSSETQDETYNVSRKLTDNETKEPALKQRGRSRSRRRVEEVKSSERQDATYNVSTKTDKEPDNETKKQTFKQRGRSRSRRRVEDDQSNERQDETYNVSKKQTEETNTKENKPSLHSQVFNGELGELQKHKEDSSTESESKSPLKMVTERRQRSKSAGRKLYSESDLFSDSFSFSDVGIIEDSQSDSMPENKYRHSTKSRGVLQKHVEQSSAASSDAESQIISPPESNLQNSVALRSEKRKFQNQNPACESSEDENEPHHNKKMCTNREIHRNHTLVEQSAEIAKANHVGESMKESKEKNTGLTDASRSKRRKKSGVLTTVSDAVEVEQNTDDIPSQNKVKSKTRSKNPNERDSERNQYQLQFEAVKRKLKELDATGVKIDSATTKKSRPLVLPRSHCSAEADRKIPPVNSHGVPRSETSPVASRKNSQVDSPKTGEESKSQEGSPSCSTTVSPSSTAGIRPLSGDSSSLGSSDGANDIQAEGRRRRAASSVCYKEPSLAVKLRRGDPHTTYLHKEEKLHVYKSPKGHRKHGKSDKLNRGVLHDLTNQSIAESEAE